MRPSQIGNIKRSSVDRLKKDIVVVGKLIDSAYGADPPYYTAVFVRRIKA